MRRVDLSDQYSKGAHGPVEAEASDRGFAATSKQDNRASVSVGAGVILCFAEMIDL
jgi:hypothetical protein